MKKIVLILLLGVTWSLSDSVMQSYNKEIDLTKEEQKLSDALNKYVKESMSSDEFKIAMDKAFKEALPPEEYAKLKELEAYMDKNSPEQAKRDTVCLKMKDLKKRLDMFTLDNGVYPDVKKYPNYRKKPYIKKIPLDAWKIPLVYIKKSDYDIEIISYAADKKKGGEGIGKDILFSECKK